MRGRAGAGAGAEERASAGVGSGAPRPALVFVGFMGAGKSTAAKTVAAELDEAAIDADRLLEDQFGEPIEDFFDREGETAFREREERLVLELLERGGVVSLGGGAVESERIREALAEHVCVWCQVDEETAWERARRSGRPLARDREAFGRRYGERLSLYEEVARAVLPDGERDLPRRALPWLLSLAEAPAVRMAWAVSDSGEYPALVGQGAAGLLKPWHRWFVVADPIARERHGALLPDHEALIEAAGGEEGKTLAEAERVLRGMAAAGARGDDALIAFGGGVVGDLAGFCAAVYQRGISVVQMPTTLVAQVDSAYGGKTGVDLPEAKNYVGAYHQPLAVLAEPAALETLPPSELASGFAEVLKTALIAGGSLWERVRGLDALDATALTGLVFDCARVKIAVVAGDERDGGGRAVLNLGHTVGHALEAATGYTRFRHGEAVGLGLLAALRVSGAGALREEVVSLLDRHGLPVDLEPIDLDAVMAALSRDKKRSGAGVNFVTLERPGQPLWGQSVGEQEIRAAIEELVSGDQGARE